MKRWEVRISEETKKLYKKYGDSIFKDIFEAL